MMGMFATVLVPLFCDRCGEPCDDGVQFKYDGPMYGLPRIRLGQVVPTACCTTELSDDTEHGDWCGLIPGITYAGCANRLCEGCSLSRSHRWWYQVGCEVPPEMLEQTLSDWDVHVSPGFRVGLVRKDTSTLVKTSPTEFVYAQIDASEFDKSLKEFYQPLVEQLLNRSAFVSRFKK